MGPLVEPRHEMAPAVVIVGLWAKVTGAGVLVLAVVHLLLSLRSR